MATQSHRVRVQLEIEERVKRIQEALPKSLEARGYDPAQAQSLASGVLRNFEEAQLSQIRSELAATKFIKGPRGAAKAAEFSARAEAYERAVMKVAPFAVGSIGSVTHVSAIDRATGTVSMQQNFAAAQSQRALARAEAFFRVIQSYDPTTGQAEASTSKYLSPEGSMTLVRAATPGELKSRLQKIRELRPGYRPGYFDPSMSGIEANLRIAQDVSLPLQQRAEALFYAQEDTARFGGRYETDIGTLRSEQREQRDISRIATKDVRSMRYRNRLAKLKAAVAAGGGRTAGLAGSVAAVEKAATAYDRDMLTGREPLARHELESELAAAEAGAREARAPTDEATYSAVRRVGAAKRAQRELEAALRGPVDLKAPGKRRSVSLDPAQQVRYDQAIKDRQAAEAILSKPDRTVAQEADASLLAKKSNDAIRELTKEMKTNTKEQKENNKMLADYDRAEAVGMGVVARSIGSRAYGLIAGMPGVSGADVNAYLGTGGIKFLTGSAQDLALNNFIQNRTAGSFGALLGTTVLNAASNVLGSFAERGLQIRKEVAQVRGERHLALGQLLNPSPLSAAFNTGIDTFSPGGAGYSPKDFYKKYGITMAEAAETGRASLSLSRKDLYGSDFFNATKTYALLSARNVGGIGKMSLTDRLAEAVTIGARVSVLNKERTALETIINTAIDRFGYGGAVSGSEMLKAAGAISAEGIPIQRLARSLYGREISMIGPGGRFQPSMGAGPIGSGVPYQAGVSELAIGAYATAVAKSSGLGLNAVQSAIAMQGMGLSNIGLGVNKLTGGVSSTALNNFAAAIRGGLPVSAASQVMGAALSMNREGMFTDLTGLAAHTRGLQEAGITPGSIGLAKTGMMQLGRGVYNTLADPYRRLSSSMAMVYALEKSGGDIAQAMEISRTFDYSSPEYIKYQSERLGGDLGPTALQAVTRLPRGDVSKFINAKPKEMTFLEGIEDELTKFFGFGSTLKPGEIANKLDVERSKADKSVSEEEKAGARERSLDEISVSLAKIADSLGALVGF